MMTRRTASIGLASSAAVAALDSPPAFELPAPRQRGGKPLIEALMLRRSSPAIAAALNRR